jgi:hypothetical protein
VPLLTYDGTTLAMTGSTINNTSIGATTPAAGTFTTATIAGTSQNLLLYSQAINSSNWTLINGMTLAGNSATAPDSTTTASTATASGTLQCMFRSFSPAIATGQTYTQSIYFKAGTANWAYINCTFVGAGGTIYGAWFNLSTGTVGTLGSALISSTITSVGSGWYRCTATGVASGGFNICDYGISNADNTLANTASQTIFAWGAQLNSGATVQTYVATTAAIATGNPILFVGSAKIGTEANSALYLQPAGTGALQAQATTSTAVGGNARGANAVDWQTARATAAQVASAQWSTISGGVSNTASATASNIGGGATNAVSNTFSGIFGGQNNTNTATYSFIGGGSSNTTGTNAYQNIVGGKSNTASGYFNFIGGGFTNSGTSASAVTTQSATMNGTTAVTLSGSNANIRVGQYITGTSIAIDTYVAAISGTSLTLSQAASGSSTSTLSFFTPHGVVVGGGNNQATGSYSVICGGGDAGTAANRNVASGDWSFVGGGRGNTASGIGAFVGNGGIAAQFTFGNTASGSTSAVVNGLANVASGNNSFIGAGTDNTANSANSVVIGGVRGITRSIIGNQVFSACNNPVASSSGVQQAALLVLGVQTTDATATALRSDTAAAGTTNQVILPNNSAYTFKGTLIANVTGGAAASSWEFRGCIERGANAASTVLVGTPRIDNIGYDSAASFWTFALTADTTNGGLRVTVTGQAGTTIRWVAKIETTEVTF